MSRGLGQPRTSRFHAHETEPWILNMAPAAGLDRWLGDVMNARNRVLAIT
jgi:hypothetical protein